MQKIGRKRTLDTEVSLSLSRSQFPEVWLFRLLERNERNDDRGRGGGRLLIMEVSLFRE